MTMKQGSDKYLKTMDLLKKSKPVTDSDEEIEREVIRKISSSSVQETSSYSFFDLLFGWTNIVWIRRSLIAVSVMLVILFVYQQSMIVRQLNWLSTQIVVNNEKSESTTISDFSGRLRFFKISGSRIPQQGSPVSEKQLDMLIEALDKLQADYENLSKIIEENPELKEMIEKKLNQKNYIKVKL
jgi:hypothetical protein